ncbi:hypothetical protein DL98DRAFT_31107 [Cadophora sp. DSE1049]|nr:hypothetical protein DL98DRAFT_31107 [Cadophora sp. DSE1049]
MHVNFDFNVEGSGYPELRLPTLTEITFRPHSAYYYSFTATIRDGYKGRGVSLAQLARLIANTVYVERLTTLLSSRLSNIRTF